MSLNKLCTHAQRHGVLTDIKCWITTMLNSVHPTGQVSQFLQSQRTENYARILAADEHGDAFGRIGVQDSMSIAREHSVWAPW
jgi:hypothetical protein